jgi:hypothetical protein
MESMKLDKYYLEGHDTQFRTETGVPACPWNEVLKLVIAH